MEVSSWRSGVAFNLFFFSQDLVRKPGKLGLQGYPHWDSLALAFGKEGVELVEQGSIRK